jgi:outer membrane protein assembly factor BamB
VKIEALVCVIAWICSGITRGDDWPQWRGPNRDGVFHERDIVQTFPKAGLKPLWRAAVGLGWSSPVIARGLVYVTDVELVAGVPKNERVHCFEASTGKPVWTRAYAVTYPEWFTKDAGGPRATPIVRDGKIYTLGAMGRLFCLDAARGEVVWDKDLATDYQVKEFTGISASPLIEDDLLILYMCGKPGACVVAFNKDSGKENWRALDDNFSYSSPIVITAGKQRQLIVWTQEGVTSLDPKTGKTWWREEVQTAGDQSVATPVHSGDRLFVAGLMMRLNPDKPAATVLWPQARAASRRVLSNTSTPLLQNDCVFSARTTGQLVCLDAASGKELWSNDTVTSLKNGSCIHLIPNGDSSLLFTDQGNLIRARLGADKYEELGRVSLIEPVHAFNGRNVVWPAPAFANACVYARNERELVCISLAATDDR